MPRQLARIIAGLTGATNFRSNAVNRAGRQGAYFPHQGRAAIAVAPHSPEIRVDEVAGDAIEIAIVLRREAGPVA